MFKTKKALVFAVLVLLASLAGTSTSWAQLNNPWSLCVADFDGDGTNDLVAVNNAGGKIAVFLNQGDGTFATTEYPGGNQGRHCAVADLNGDGAPDVVVASNDAQKGTTVMLNNGDGTFSTTDYNSGAGTWSVAIEDLNGDGAPDIVVARSGSGGQLVVFLNDGAGQFSPAPGSPFASGTDSRFVALFDIDGDNLLDAVVANYSVGQISVLPGNGDGTFDAANRASFYVDAGEPSRTADHPNRMVVADFNNDGVLDFVHGNHGARSADLEFHGGTGTGSFSDPILSDTRIRPESIAGPADFDGDGNWDVVVGSDTNGFMVKLGNGDGSFTSRPELRFLIGSRVRAIGIGDFNGDGIPDIAIAGQIPDAPLRIYLNDGQGNFTLQE